MRDNVGLYVKESYPVARQDALRKEVAQMDEKKGSKIQTAVDRGVPEAYSLDQSESTAEEEITLENTEDEGDLARSAQ
jgi:hypothetical protein